MPYPSPPTLEAGSLITSMSEPKVPKSKNGVKIGGVSVLKTKKTRVRNESIEKASNAKLICSFSFFIEQGAWTIKPPAYLEKAAGLEEQEENLRRNHSQSPNGHNRRRILPTPPQLPRHLDKVILNARAPSSAGVVSSTREGRSSSISGQTSPSSERGRATHPNQGGAWPTPMTGLSPGGTALPGGEGGRKGGRRDSGGSGGSADRGAVKNRRGSSSMDVGVYGGLIVSEGGGMTGFGAGIGSPIGDDNSVLPLPSHSVVNHLATSAIRNGVLAVATTTRYKAKVCAPFFHAPVCACGEMMMFEL